MLSVAHGHGRVCPLCGALEREGCKWSRGPGVVERKAGHWVLGESKETEKEWRGKQKQLRSVRKPEGRTSCGDRPPQPTVPKEGAQGGVSPQGAEVTLAQRGRGREETAGCKRCQGKEQSRLGREEGGQALTGPNDRGTARLFIHTASEPLRVQGGARAEGEKAALVCPREQPPGPSITPVSRAGQLLCLQRGLQLSPRQPHRAHCLSQPSWAKEGHSWSHQ